MYEHCQYQYTTFYDIEMLVVLGLGFDHKAVAPVCFWMAVVVISLGIEIVKVLHDWLGVVKRYNQTLLIGRFINMWRQGWSDKTLCRLKFSNKFVWIQEENLQWFDFS